MQLSSFSLLCFTSSARESSFPEIKTNDVISAALLFGQYFRKVPESQNSYTSSACCQASMLLLLPKYHSFFQPQRGQLGRGVTKSQLWVHICSDGSAFLHLLSCISLSCNNSLAFFTSLRWILSSNENTFCQQHHFVASACRLGEVEMGWVTE